MYEGIRQLTFCQKGYLRAVTPLNVINWGLGNVGSFIYEDAPVKGENDEDLPNQVNFKIAANSLQGTIRDLDVLINTFCKGGGADVQVVTEKETTSVYGGVYDFLYTGSAGPDKHMGVGFKMVESSKERYLNLMGEVSLPEELAKEIIQSALVNEPLDLYTLGYGHRGKVPANYKKPYLSHIYSPSEDLDVLVNGSEVIDYNLTLSTIANKLDYDRDDVAWINVNLKITTNKAKGTDLLAWFTASRYNSLQLVSKNASGQNTWTFGEGTLWRKNKINIDNKSRNVELVFNKNFALSDFTINTSTNTVTVSAAV